MPPEPSLVEIVSAQEYNEKFPPIEIPLKDLEGLMEAIAQAISKANCFDPIMTLSARVDSACNCAIGKVFISMAACANHRPILITGPVLGWPSHQNATMYIHMKTIGGMLSIKPEDLSKMIIPIISGYLDDFAREHGLKIVVIKP